MSAVYMPLLLSALSLLISVISFFYFRSYLKRRTGQERILSEMREEVNSILRSIDETTDRDISLIEERERNLKSLLTDIEKRLLVYMREKEKRREAEDVSAALSQKKAEPSAPASRQQAAAQTENVYTELGRNRYQGNGNKREIPPAGESLTESENVQPAFPLPRFRVKPEPLAGKEEASASLSVGGQIRELVRAGFTIPAIASRLGLSIAEVEFAAALLERGD